MTGGLIFKMELFKFFKDRKYLIATGVLAVLNTIATIYFMFLLTNSDGLESGSFLERSLPIFIILTSILFLVNSIFVYLFPFHIVSIDYKNNVMAMMIASGVNRTRLYFSKIGAVVLCTLGVVVAISIGPIIVILLKNIQTGDLNQTVQAILDVFNMININIEWVPIIVLGLLNVLDTIVILMTATILTKGKGSAILLFFGLSFINSLLAGFVNQFAFSTNVDGSMNMMVQIVTSFVSIIIFGFISLRTIQTQNL